jgi:hypothetical protein
MNGISEPLDQDEIGTNDDHDAPQGMRVDSFPVDLDNAR